MQLSLDLPTRFLSKQLQVRFPGFTSKIRSAFEQILLFKNTQILLVSSLFPFVLQASKPLIEPLLSPTFTWKVSIDVFSV